MSDYLLTIAAEWDREPCRCTLTDRGTDSLGCEIHDDGKNDGSNLDCADCGESPSRLRAVRGLPPVADPAAVGHPMNTAPSAAARAAGAGWPADPLLVLVAARWALSRAMLPRANGSRHLESCRNARVNSQWFECSKDCSRAQVTLFCLERLADGLELTAVVQLRLEAV